MASCSGIAAALAQTAPATSADTSKGKSLVNGDGMTLYIFDRDVTANRTAMVNAPAIGFRSSPTVDAKAAGDFTLVTRDDGRKQWAYKGKPLYTWSKDSKPGDATGDGVNSVWHIAAP